MLIAALWKSLSILGSWVWTSERGGTITDAMNWTHLFSIVRKLTYSCTMRWLTNFRPFSSFKCISITILKKGCQTVIKSNVALDLKCQEKDTHQIPGKHECTQHNLPVWGVPYNKEMAITVDAIGIKTFITSTSSTFTCHMPWKSRPAFPRLPGS